MSDFFQNGVITTFHKLGECNLTEIELELKSFSKIRPIALVLPSLYREYSSGTLPNIMSILKNVQYLKEIILCLDRANKSQFLEVKSRFADVRRLSIIWNDGPNMKKLYKQLDGNMLSPGERGKGRAVWISLGYVLAGRRSRVIALHDSDIVNYDRRLLARLCYPVTTPHFEYEFCKGYYSRITNKMHGRATRLFFTPLIRALEKLLGYLPFLVYLDSFRYALAGEIAMRRDLAMAMRIPSDWGLEVGTLSEVYRNMALKRICQVDIAEAYEHKHQPLSPDNPNMGILKMTVDITKSILRNLVLEGAQFSEGFFKSLSQIYLKIARETLIQYESDAAINGLDYSRHDEAVCVETFAEGLKQAGENFWVDASPAPLIPNWHRVTAALPDFFQSLLNAIREDKNITG